MVSVNNTPSRDPAFTNTPHYCPCHVQSAAAPTRTPAPPDTAPTHEAPVLPSLSTAPTPTEELSSDSSISRLSAILEAIHIEDDAPAPSATTTSFSKSRTERAIALLQEEYVFNVNCGMVALVNMLTDDGKAGVFLALQPGAVRDLWLQTQLDIIKCICTR